MHAHPRMGRDTHACGVRSARRRRAIIVVPARRQNQEHIHSGAGWGDGDVAGPGVAAGAELSFHDVRRYRFSKSRYGVDESAVTRPWNVFGAGLRCEISAQILLSTVRPVA